MFRDNQPVVVDDYNIQLPNFDYGDDLFLNLSNDQQNELIKILNDADNLELMRENLERFYKKHAQDQQEFDSFYAKFLENIQKRYADILNDLAISVSDALITTINGETSYLVMTLFALLDAFSLSLALVSAVTIVFGALTIATGIYIFITEYMERAEEKRQMEEDFNFLLMKTICAESIIYCREKNIRKEKTPEDNRYIDEDVEPVSFDYLPLPNPVSAYKKYDEPSLLIRLKPAVLKAVMTFTMLLSTYFLGSAIIITAFGASAIAAAATGPIGIGIAIGIALAIGLFVLYKTYQATKVSNAMEHLKSNMDAGLKSLENDICENNLSPDPQNAQKISHESSDSNKFGLGRRPSNANFSVAMRGHFARRPSAPSAPKAPHPKVEIGRPGGP